MLPFITPLAFSNALHDVLIIGGGTAGLTLAGRLSEDPTISVGVIEAGHAQFDNPLVDVPGFFGMAFGSDLDWGFHSEPQMELNGTVLSYPRGRMLGGSSGLNFMLWNRPSRQDYDDWEALGNAGWGWDAMFEYGKKSEGFFPPVLESQLEVLENPPFNAAFHGTSGPVRNSFGKWYPEPTTSFAPALEALGIPQNPDSMGGSNLGGYISLQSIDPRNATRSYSATAYLRPNLGRPNLAILTGAQATKVVLDGGKRATGVEFVVNGTTYRVNARKEVVLSAGAFQSPQLLELSGIGNCTLLEEVGIECLVESPGVGMNLQDHAASATVYEMIPGTITSALKSNATILAEWLAEYTQNHTGPLSSSSTEFAMIPLPLFLPASEIASLAALAHTDAPTSPPSPLDALLLEHLSNASIPLIEITFETAMESVSNEPGKAYLTLVPGLMHPFSRGSVHAASADPLAPPLINPSIYSRAVDRAIMVAAIKFTDMIATTSPAKEFLVARVSPPPMDRPLTDQEWEEQVNDRTSTEYHPVGTCAMLPKALGGVVDARLRVYGVEGLRVVDASIVPKHVAIHPQSAVYALAEKAASMMKEDLGRE